MSGIRVTPAAIRPHANTGFKSGSFCVTIDRSKDGVRSKP